MVIEHGIWFSTPALQVYDSSQRRREQIEVVWIKLLIPNSLLPLGRTLRRTNLVQSAFDGFEQHVLDTRDNKALIDKLPKEAVCEFRAQFNIKGFILNLIK